MPVTPIESLDDFNATINNKDKVVIVDFWATWCRPCKMIGPVFEKYSNIYTDIEFRKVETDSQPEISQEMSIRSLPTFIAFKDGQKLQELPGVNPVALEVRIVRYHVKTCLC
ncbi:thioredoxin TrxA [Stereum hirsutum FP-91666 SS1]|uniref:thioredoxin TrxA n=1 Tax=Stereum hirsutum (strain FP-91666) TaxID=721885 RepID=UPI000440BA62|nr:thioredoxin TrxA [Stereum hirsutum FP-91666 SS1]EIM90131.1 thioredoxin TrxA [Stereum hirsutum FP-91666 SS1]